MDVLQVFNEREELTKALSESYSHLWKKGQESAQAEHDYKVANAIEIFRLHTEQKVAWTTCQTLAHGEIKVADLRLARDLAQVQYSVMGEKIQGLKLQLRLVESQIERDWSQSKRGV